MLSVVPRPAAFVQESTVRPMTVADEPSDEALVLQARGGSHPAFETLVRRHQKPLYFLCLRYVRDHDTAADLTQRAFIRVMEKLHELREAQIFRSWLFRIGVNLALNHLRDHARFVDDSGLPAETPVAPEALSTLESLELTDSLRRAVAELPTKQRMTLELRVYEELSFRDIAAALETTEGAAKVNFHYAVKRLRTLLAKTPAGSQSGQGG